MRRNFLLIMLAFKLVSALPAIDLSINGRNLAVFDSEALAGFLPENESSVPLGVFYPWLSSFEYLEAQSEANRIWWDAETVGPAAWKEARLVRVDGSWQLHVGQDVFSNPDRIEVTGVPVEVEVLRIWSAAELPELRRSLEMILDIKGTSLDWRLVNNPDILLSESYDENPPHLVISHSLLSGGRTIAGPGWQWYLAEQEDGVGFPAVLAADAYRPEAPLYWLMATEGELFDGKDLSDDVGDFLAWVIDSLDRGSLLVSSDPLEELAMHQATAALLLPGDKAEEGFLPSAVPKPFPGEDAALPLYAAVSRNLPDPLQREAVLLLDLLTLYAQAPREISYLTSPNLNRFNEAWERIARLVISGQMSIDTGMELMNRYINGE